jgi:hypothetical protein
VFDFFFFFLEFIVITISYNVLTLKINLLL